MTKRQREQIAHLQMVANHAPGLIQNGYASRVLSAMIRAANPKAAAELKAFAATIPAVINHPDFII